MKAAIYARRSKEEHQAASIEVQTGEAQRFITQRGWRLDSHHIFIDDSTSRAEFKRRPGLVALLNAAETREFGIVVVRDETRLGGDTFRTGLVIQEILDAGLQLFYYYTEEEIALDDAISKFLVAARNFASELEREKISQRTHEHLHTKARRRLNVGGRVYGYNNMPIDGGGVGYGVNPQEAEVIRCIFEKYANGIGQRSIARALNQQQVPPPRAGRRGTGSWSPGAVRAMLKNDRYRGVYTWNRIRKTYRGGTKVREPRPRKDWVQEQAPELRIITDDLWNAVQQRFAANADRAHSRPFGAGRRPHYLLSGIARCSSCGGPLAVNTTRIGTSRVPAYICAYHRDRGPAVCTNVSHQPVLALDQAIADWISTHILSRELGGAVIERVRELCQDQNSVKPDEHAELVTEAEQLQTEILRLTDALARASEGGVSIAIVEAITLREEQLRQLKQKIKASLPQPSAPNLDVDHLTRAAKQRLEDLAESLRNNHSEARGLLQTLLGTNRITATPGTRAEGCRYRLESKTASGTPLKIVVT